MDYSKNINKLYLITLFQAFIPAYVIERLFWQNRGISIQGVVYCEIVYALVITLFEIPSGMLSDRFGRKRLLVINGLLMVFEFVILLFASRFWLFASAVAFSGIGKALASGSLNALLYDSLVSINQQSDFEKVVGRIMSIDFIGSIVAALCGSFLSNYFVLEINYIISIISMFASFVLTFSLVEPLTQKNQKDLLEMKDYTKQALLFFKTHPDVLLYCSTGAMMGATIIYLDEFWQLILDDMGIPVAFFGLVSAILLSSRIPGNIFAHHLKKRFTYHGIFSWIILIVSIGFVSIYWFQNFFCIITILLIGFVSGALEPLVFGYLHHRSNYQIRATVESFYSLGLRSTSAILGLLFGFVSGTYSMYVGFVLLGIICFVFLIVFQLLNRNINDKVL